jgi:hypothetical protein
MLPDAEDGPARGGISRKDAEAQRFLKTNFLVFQLFPCPEKTLCVSATLRDSCHHPIVELAAQPGR